jgi:REP element-mobilizing transposase RayT
VVITAQDIFYKHADRHVLDEIIHDALAQTGTRVHAYCSMTNHLQLVGAVIQQPIGR